MTITADVERTSDKAVPGDPVGWLLAGVLALPDRLVSSFLVACLPVGLSVAFDVFRPALVVPAVVVAVVAFWYWTPSDYLRSLSRRTSPPSAASLQRSAFGVGAAFVVAFVWLWVNQRYTSQYVVLARDPGIYTLRGIWLIHHSSSLIDVTTAQQAAAGIANTDAGSLAFTALGNDLNPQSNGLVPGLLAVSGWVGGLTGVLKGNLVLGAIALISVYGFARRVTGPVWALVPMIALAAGVPMIAFSRSPFSEPTSLAAVFGGLTLIWTAWESGRVTRFLAAGLLLGVDSLARIDGSVTLIGVLAGFGVIGLGARSKEVRRLASVAAGLVAIGAGFDLLMSIVDELRNSREYIDALKAQLVPLIAVTIVLALVAVGVGFVPLAPIRNWLYAHGRTAGLSAVGLSVVIAVVMISRPLWWTAHFDTAPGTGPAITAMQANAKLPLDYGRSYDESTVNWLGMYFGWPTVILAALGAALAMYLVVCKRDVRLAVFAMTIACVSALYLNRISIFPDQIWAMRRFLPVVLPGMLITATIALEWVAQRFVRFSWISGTLGVVVVVSAMTPWGPIWTSVNGGPAQTNAGGQIAEMDVICATVHGRPVVLAGPNPGAAYYLPTLVISCGDTTVTYTKPTQAGLALLKKRLGPSTVVLTFSSNSVPWAEGVPAPLTSVVLAAWDQPLQKVPEVQNFYGRQSWFGTLSDDGRVVGATG